MAKTTPITLDNEINEIITKSKNFIMPDHTLIVHTKDDDITIPHFNSIQIERNFTENISDVLHIEFLTGLGLATKVLYKNRDALEATIKLKFSDKKILQRRYKLVLLTKFEDIHNSKMSKASQDELDSQDFILVKAQCIDRLMLKLKNEYVSGVFHNYDLKTFVKGLFSKRMRDLNVDAYINIHDFDNSKIYENIMIDPFTKFVKLPFILQNGNYGLYNHGANIYFSNLSETNKIKYDVDIYPVYDYKRFDDENKRSKLLLINPSIEHTDKNNFNFYYKDGIYKTLVSDIEFKTDSEGRRYKVGNGIIIEHSNNTINNNLFTVTDDKITHDGDATYDEIKIDDTRSFNNFIETLGDDNTYRYYSTLNRVQGIIGSVMLPKVNPEVIYPGMPFKYLFNDDGKIGSTTGSVQGLNYVYDFINKTTVVMLVCIFKRIKKDS